MVKCMNKFFNGSANIDLLFEKGSGYIRRYPERDIRFLDGVKFNIVKDYSYDDGATTYLVERGLNDIDYYGAIISHGSAISHDPMDEANGYCWVMGGSAIFPLLQQDYEIIIEGV